MSNLYDNEKNTPNSENASDKRLSFIQTDLLEALHAWQELEKAEVKLSPEEEQLIKIKIIIEQLRDKLQQF